jgi:hypothetical protein
MGLSTTTTLFLFVVFLCIGVVIGAMFNRRKTEKPQPGPQVQHLERPGEYEVLRAWRSEAGQPWLEMDGSRLDNPAALQEEQRRRLLKLVLDLRPWLDAAAATPPVLANPVSAAPSVASTPAQSTPAAPSAAPTPLTPASPISTVGSLATPVLVSPITPAAPSASASGEKKILPKMPVAVAPPPAVNLKSIVEQIDDVLQSNLKTSQYKDREIRLVEGTDGSVVVVLDGSKYIGLDAVPDPSVQSFIRKAAEDWDRGSK